MQRHKFTLGALVVLGGLSYIFFTGFQQSTARHMTLATLAGKIERADLEKYKIQLGGCTVVEGSIQWDEYQHRPEFNITDGTNTMRVRYTGNAVLPDTFRDKSQVVLEGRYLSDKGVFDAKVVFAKCPSKYEGQSYEGHVEAMKTL